MKVYNMNDFSFDKWAEQNGGAINLEYCGFKDGILLDNLFIAAKRGYVVLKETAINEWHSMYKLYFAKYGDKESVDALFSLWDAIRPLD